jgi:hypothetical protein
MEFDKKPGKFRKIAAAFTQSASLRVCMPTWRNFTRSYRWNEIFRAAGNEPVPGMAARKRRLKDAADFLAASVNRLLPRVLIQRGIRTYEA